MRLTFGQPFNRYAWVVNPPDTVQDYSSNINRILGAIFSGIVSKITSFPEEKGAKKTKKMLKKVNANILATTAYMRRHPTSQALVDIGQGPPRAPPKRLVVRNKDNIS